MKIILKIASLISWAGHPLFTSALLITLISFKRYPIHDALVISGIVLFGVILPANLYTYFKVRSGAYSNFDVSDRKQRSSFYITIIIMMSIVTAFLFYFQPDTHIAKGSLLTVILFMTAYALNQCIKLSSQVALSIYFSFILLQFYSDTAPVLFTFTGLIVGSRLILKRHSATELIAGTVLGFYFGLLMHYSKK